MVVAVIVVVVVVVVVVAVIVKTFKLSNSLESAYGDVELH